MIKLQDFAKNQGVTDRQIQRLVKKYADELEGNIYRRGHNGTWLADEACEILRSKMKQAPVAVFEEDPRAAKLEVENADLRKTLNDVYARLADVLEKSNELQLQLQAAQGEQKILAAGREAAEKKASDLEVENRALVAKKIEAELKLEETKKDLQDANFDLETAQNIAEANEQEAARAKTEAEDLRRELEELKAFNALPWWKKIRTKKPPV